MKTFYQFKWRSWFLAKNYLNLGTYFNFLFINLTIMKNIVWFSLNFNKVHLLKKLKIVFKLKFKFILCVLSIMLLLTRLHEQSFAHLFSILNVSVTLMNSWTFSMTTNNNIGRCIAVTIEYRKIKCYITFWRSPVKSQ